MMGNYDEINPDHYKGFSNGAEVIDIVETLSYNCGAAIKYLARAGRKPGADVLTDLRKAAWYVAREIERIKRSTQKATTFCDSPIPGWVGDGRPPGCVGELGHDGDHCIELGGQNLAWPSETPAPTNRVKFCDASLFGTSGPSVTCYRELEHPGSHEGYWRGQETKWW